MFSWWWNCIKCLKRWLTSIGLNKAVLFMYLLLQIIQVRCIASNTDRDNQVQLYMSLYRTATEICIRVSSLLRHLQYLYVTNCAMVKVYDHWIKVLSPDTLHPILLDLITSSYFCGYYFQGDGMNIYVPIFRSDLHWIGVWIHFIYNIDKYKE